ncbi:unnamed protein product [Meganyctiphanes norvegica]|uniref:C-type lectin domain-containing protein n=1 Tax=Meganyctiphanes norvegica TaxID=48144 RepID=A0AAV2Q243_MEGNR
MDWSILMIICICLSREYAHACDEECKAALIEEFRIMLDSKLNPIQADLRNVKSELTLLGGTVADIYTSTDGLDGRSSQSQLATEAVKKMQETMSEDIRTVKEKVVMYEGKLNAIETIKIKVDSNDINIKEIKTQLTAIESEFEELSEFRNIIKEEVQPIFSILDDKFKPVNHMKEDITTIKDSIRILDRKYGDTLHDISEINDSVKILDRKYGDTLDDISEINEWTKEIHMYTNDATTKQTSMSVEIQEIESKLESYEASIKTIKPIMTKVESFESGIGEISKEHQELTKNIINSEDILLDTFTMTAIGLSRCPEGFFGIMSTHCFKIFKDQKTNWSDAENLCRSHDLVLAEPSDRMAMFLSRFLLHLYGEGSFWLNGQGDGTKFIWLNSNKTLDSNNQLWSPGKPGDRVSHSYCLSLLLIEEDVRNYHGQPYYPYDCSEKKHFPLCEDLIQDTQLLKSPLQNLEENITHKLDDIENKIMESDKILLKSISYSSSIDCPDGLFNIAAQCFKILRDQKRNWVDAKNQCKSRSLKLAQPMDSAACALATYLVVNYGDSSAWVGSTGDGSKFVWCSTERTTLNINSPLWLPSYPGSNFSPNQCVALVFTKSSLRSHPEQVYEVSDYSSLRYTLCEAE